MSEPPAPETRAITLEVELPGTPEEVTRMLSDPAELARWFAPFVDGSGQVGALLTFGWTPEMQWNTRLEAVTPGRLVRWHDAPAEQGPAGAYPAMVVEWTLTPTGGGTRLRLVQSGFGQGADWDDQYDATKAGWRFFLWHLAETLQHHRGEPRRVLLERRSSDLTREALGTRLFGPEGLALAPSQPAPHAPAQLRLGGRAWAFDVQHARLPTHLWGKLPELGGAVLLVEMEPGRTGPLHAGLYLSTWTLEPGTLDALRTGLRSLADAVFGPAPA